MHGNETLFLNNAIEFESFVKIILLFSRRQTLGSWAGCTDGDSGGNKDKLGIEVALTTDLCKSGGKSKEMLSPGRTDFVLLTFS